VETVLSRNRILCVYVGLLCSGAERRGKRVPRKVRRKGRGLGIFTKQPNKGRVAKGGRLKSFFRRGLWKNHEGGRQKRDTFGQGSDVSGSGGILAHQKELFRRKGPISWKRSLLKRKEGIGGSPGGCNSFTAHSEKPTGCEEGVWGEEL